jgi:hypothetical protein
MRHIFEGNRSGKSFSQMIQLKQNIEMGVTCGVATSNPEKVKQDFEYMTGSKLILTSTKGSDILFDASLAPRAEIEAEIRHIKSEE